LQTGEALGAAELEDEELEDEAATLDDEPEDEATEDDVDADDDTDDEVGIPQFLSKKVETGRPGRIVKPVDADTSNRAQITKVIEKLTHLESL
jgi:hypothetical protein